MIRHFFSAQFLLFVIVGSTAALLHWMARYLLSYWFSFPVAVALAYAVGLGVAFELNRRLVFPSSSRSAAEQARDFLLVNLAFFPVVWSASVWIKQSMVARGFHMYVDGIAHGIAIAIPVFLTFLIYKFFTFGEGRAE